MGKALFSIVLVLCVACGARQPPRVRPAELRVVAVPGNAVVMVNETFVGSAAALAKRPAQLKPGKKRVTIEARGYFPHDVEVDFQPGVTTIDIKLRPVPP